MAERAEKTNQVAPDTVAGDTRRDFCKLQEGVGSWQPCPILREAQVYEGQAGAGVELCLNCPYEVCIFDERTREQKTR